MRSFSDDSGKSCSQSLTLISALGNVLLEVFVVNPTPGSTAITGMIILTGVYSLAAFFIIWRHKAQRLAKTAVVPPSPAHHFGL